MPLHTVEEIRNYNAGRELERLSLKYQKMRSGEFSFLRGSCHLFYARLGELHTVDAAPLVWLCGDMHMENFGSYKGDNRLVYFDINDFDEAALGPITWDLARMLTSIALYAQEAQVKSAERALLCQLFVKTYARMLASGKPYWLERDTAQGPVQNLLDGLRNRSRVDWLNSRTETIGKKRNFRIDGKKSLAATADQREAVCVKVEAFAKHQADPDFFKVIDVARRIAGTGSLGLERYCILVKGKGSPDGNHILDLKLAAPSSLATYLTVQQPVWASEADRVVTLQQRVQAVPMAFLNAISAGASSYILRGLQASEDRVNTAAGQITQANLRQVIESMAQLAAWGHLRGAARQGAAGPDALIEFGQQSGWQTRVLALAQACADQVRADAAVFNAALDDGALHV